MKIMASVRTPPPPFSLCIFCLLLHKIKLPIDIVVTVVFQKTEVLATGSGNSTVFLHSAVLIISIMNDIITYHVF